MDEFGLLLRGEVGIGEGVALDDALEPVGGVGDGDALAGLDADVAGAVGLDEVEVPVVGVRIVGTTREGEGGLACRLAVDVPVAVLDVGGACEDGEFGILEVDGRGEFEVVGIEGRGLVGVLLLLPMQRY